MIRRLPSPLERSIAVRYLRGRKASRFASLTTMIAVGGVAVGVAALIVVLGVMNGLRDDLRDRILVANPHLHLLVYGASLRMDNWREALAIVRKDPEVVAAAPEVLSESIVINHAGYPSALKIIGIDADTGAASVTTLPQAVEKPGAFSFTPHADSVDGGIIIGYRLAARLSAYPGDVVTMISPAFKRNRVTGLPNARYWHFEITGTFNTGMYQYDDGFAVMDLPTAQRFTEIDSAVTGVQIRLRDPWHAPEVGRRLQSALGYPYRSLDWQSQNQSIFSALKLEKLAMGLIICFIMLVAAFNIIGTLTMMVVEKTKEIGILQAMGLPPGGVGRIFLTQGAIIGAVGTGIGVILGLAMSYVLDASGIIKIDPAVYFIDHLPVHVEVLDVLAVMVFSLMVALVATLHPSRAAARLTPVEAIRHE